MQTQSVAESATRQLYKKEIDSRKLSKDKYILEHATHINMSFNLFLKSLSKYNRKHTRNLTFTFSMKDLFEFKQIVKNIIYVIMKI